MLTGAGREGSIGIDGASGSAASAGLGRPTGRWQPWRIVAPLAWLWQASRMPAAYSVMEMGYLDYGGGASLIPASAGTAATGRAWARPPLGAGALDHRPGRRPGTTGRRTGRAGDPAADADRRRPVHSPDSPSTAPRPARRSAPRRVSWSRCTCATSRSPPASRCTGTGSTSPTPWTASPASLRTRCRSAVSSPTASSPIRPARSGITPTRSPTLKWPEGCSDRWW